MLGLKRGTVRLVPYAAEWAIAFQQERAVLLHVIGHSVVDIQHVGSTSVPGLAAKPILDIGVAVASLTSVPTLVDPLQEIGYTYFGDRQQKGEHFFAKGPEEMRTVYVHVLEITDPAWEDYLIFRDYLTTNPTQRVRYMLAKQSLAERFANDRYAYTESKSKLIQEIIALARSARQVEEVALSLIHKY